MDASDLIKTLHNPLAGGVHIRPHMGVKALSRFIKQSISRRQIPPSQFAFEATNQTVVGEAGCNAYRLVKKCVFVGGDACSLAQSTHRVVDQPSFWGLISLRFEQRISNGGVAARFGVKRRQFPILVSNADVSIAEYCRSKPPKAFRWLPFLSRGHGSVGGRVFPSAKHSRVQPRAHGRAARLVFLGFFGVHGTRLPWGPRGLQQLSGHIACCLSSTVPDWDREYNCGLRRRRPGITG